MWLELIRSEFLPPTHLPWPVIGFRLIWASLLAAAIGIDREIKSRPAGLRTHMLVSLAAALFAVVMIEIMNAGFIDPDTARTDPLRVIEAVTAGVAFLGAGAIIRSGGGVHGLTTGAALWLAGGIGLACGAGYAGIATLATLIGVIILVLLRIIEDRVGTKD